MIRTYISIAQAIKNKVPSINWFDLDKGQLDAPESFNSIIVPGILIGQADVDWSQLAGGHQQGTGSITVKTVVVLPAQTHLLDPNVLDNLDKLIVAETVNTAVLAVPGILTRLKTKEYWAGTFYVVEQTYEGAFKDGPSYLTVTVTPKFIPSLHKPANA